MVKSFRGQEFNMIDLATKNSSNMSIGNVRMNGRGDLIGADGKVVKTREEQIAEYMEKHNIQTGTASIKKSEPTETHPEPSSEILEVTPIKPNKKKEKVIEEKLVEEPAPEVVFDGE